MPEVDIGTSTQTQENPAGRPGSAAGSPRLGKTGLWGRSTATIFADPAASTTNCWHASVKIYTLMEHPAMRALNHTGAIGLLAAIAWLPSCAPAERVGPAGQAAQHEGRYTATGGFVSGSAGCFRLDRPLQVTLIVTNGEAQLPLRGGRLSGVMSGPVGSDGRLDGLRWSGTIGVVARTSGQISGRSMRLEYRYDYVPDGASDCLYRYEG